MKKKILGIGIFILIVIAAAGIGIFFYLSGRTKFNEGYVNGNTAGNLYNEGLFCEKDGIIYFANPSDMDKLYSMRAGGGEITKLSDDVVSYINVDDHYIYYIRKDSGSGGKGDFAFLKFNTNSLCRLDRDGDVNSLLILDTEPCMYASLVGNYIYYLRYTEGGTTLCKVKIDGSEQTQISAEPFFTASTQGQYIYYNGLDKEHYIWRLNTEDDSMGMIFGGNCWMPIVTDENTAYFMDCDRRYAISRANFLTEEKEEISSDRVDCYNIYGNTIFYQHSDPENPALCKMNLDGSGHEVIANGNYMNLNATSSYLYFRDFFSEETFRVPIGGGIVEEFSPGTGVPQK